MPISNYDLRSAASRSSRATFRKSLSEATAYGAATAFLCHSHDDRPLVEGLLVLLAESGWDVYVDWRDNEMPSSPNAETARRIRQKIASLDWFLFLATSNSTGSRWCPWEIGIADRSKAPEKIVIIPTIDESGRHHGNEYLQLYSQIEKAQSGGLACFPAGQDRGRLLSKL